MSWITPTTQSTFGQPTTSAFGQPTTSAFGTTSFGGLSQQSTACTDTPISAGLPDDSISSLCWSPTANFLSVASWDKTVRIWEVQQTSLTTCQTAAKAMKAPSEQPLLASCWQADGSAVYCAGADKTVRKWDLGSDQVLTIGMHDAPVTGAVYASSVNLLVTGSWDRTLRYWDTRAPNCIHRHTLPERCYALSCKNTLLVAATAGGYIEIINLQQPQSTFRQLQPAPPSTNLMVSTSTIPEELKNPLNGQLRCITCCADGQGFLFGSVEGRAASYYVDDPKRGMKESLSFSFKCHRNERPGAVVDVYAVNAIASHPKEIHALCTAGADGCYQFWEKAMRRKIASGTVMEPENKVPAAGTKVTPVRGNNLPITAMEFNADGNLLGYAHSYDWSRGHAYNEPNTTDPKMKPAVFVRCVQESDIKAEVKK